jgi:glycosyltransferase involved in cell wall biosynthesis
VRILKVTQVYHPYLEKGGTVPKIKALAEHLTRRGHKVSVLTAHQGRPSRPGEVQNNRREGIEVIYLPTWLKYRTATLNPGVLAFCSRRLRDFDVVHVYGLYDSLGPAVAWFCRRWRIPYLAEPDGMLRPIIRSIRKKRLYYSLLGRRMLTGATRLVATSELERAVLIHGDFTEHKVVQRRNGLELGDFRNLPDRGAFRASLGIGSKETLVVFLGRISFIKGLDLLVEAFEGLQGSSWLALVGPDDKDGCRDAIRTKTGERVRLTGPLYGREKLEALVDADLVVLPSRYESFGNAAAEAVACDTPVLVTDQCGIAPLIKDRVGLVVSCSVEGIREGLARLLGDDALRQSLRARCPEVARELSWDEPVALMESVYTEVVAEMRRVQ